MAAAPSPAASMRRSHTSSSSSLQRDAVTQSHHVSRSQSPSSFMPAEKLVDHALAAKRSLSTMTMVLRANEIANAARQAHEDSSIFAAQTGFLKSCMLDQLSILNRMRASFQATYDWARKDFKRLVKAMDEVGGELEDTMALLRDTHVQKELRGDGEDRRCLMDFVDETSVESAKAALRKSIQELQNAQQSYDGDLLRFDTDIRNVKGLLTKSETLHLSNDTGEDDTTTTEEPSSTELLYQLVDHSSTMAQLLTSLTKHFDMCVIAIRTTKGAAALVRRKAASAEDNREDTQSEEGDESDPVTFSGVIAEREKSDANHFSDLEPRTAADRIEMLRVVLQDAQEVDDVVHEIHDHLSAMESEHSLFQQRHDLVTHTHMAILQAFSTLTDLDDRMPTYLAAEADFRTRWHLEKDSVFARLREMKEMREFYEGYAGAYDSLILEMERRKGVEDKVKGIWSKAQEGVNKLLEQDRAARETFRMDVGDFLPTDLWAGMNTGERRWEVVPVEVDGEGRPL